jgi:hypothetical protein
MSKEFFAWRSRHFVQVSEYSWRPKNHQTEKLIRDEFSKHAVAIKLEDATKGIPEPLHSVFPFCWDEGHRQRIERFMATNEVELPTGRVRQAHSEGAFLSVFRQLTSGLVYAGDGDSQAYLLSSARIDALEALIDGTQGPVLVAVYYRAEVEALLRRLKGTVRSFVGSTPPGERARLITDWNADRIPVLLAAPSAMGHGINLQHGSSRTIVWYSHSFDWAQRAQFNARLVRSGQSKTVSIVNLVADAGLDLLALRALESKEASEKSILEALDIRHHFSKVEEAHAAA